MPAEPDAELTHQLEDACAKAGADVFGCADLATIHQLSKDNHPEKYLVKAQTVVVIGIHLYDLILDAWSQPPGPGNGYQFADQILDGICYRAKDFLAEHDHESVVVSYGGLLLKEIAAVAGIGPIGKNNLLLTPAFGPQVRLRALVTDAPLVCGTPILSSDICKECLKCINACPANAFAKGKYDRSTCEPYQLGHLRYLSENTTIWCNICIEACPVGHHSGWIKHKLKSGIEK